MTDSPGDTTKKCEFCDKRGLPLLLVRDAVAPANEGAPLAPALPLDLPSHAAHYTKRLLRTGYLNVYDEARKRWDAYFVTQDGYYFKMMLTPGVIPVKPQKPFNCPDQGHAEIAGVISVPDPANATKVWIGFSDVLWTDAVRKRNDDAAVRKRHMVAIDIKAALAGGPVRDCRPLSQLSAVVAEYAMDKAKGEKTFAWSAHTFTGRQGRAERMRKACDAMRPGKGLIVTVPDPVGVATELALLMKRNVDYFTQEPERKRHLAANAAIGSIRQGVRDRAMLVEKAAAEDVADTQARDGWFMLLISEDARKQSEKLRHVSPAEAATAADREWLRYTAKFDDPARKAWETKYHADLSAYDGKWVGPLALSHATLMKSRELADYFECNYDSGNIHSGAVYTDVFTKCAAGTQDKNACIKLYQEWIAGDMSDTRNLLLRALVFNQEEVAKAVAKAVKVSIDWRSIPWDNLIAAFAASIEALAKSAQEAVAGLIVTFGGPIAFLFRSILDGKYGIRGGVMALGMIAKHPIIKLEITDKRKEFRKLVAKELLQRSGVALDPKKLSSAVGAEMLLQDITGIKKDGNVHTTWLAFVDENIGGMPPNLSDAEQYDWMTKHVRNAAGVEAMNVSKFRRVITKELRFGVIGGLMQYAALTKLVDDEGKALTHNREDAQYRLYAGRAALAATTADVLGNAWKAAGQLKYGVDHVFAGSKWLFGGVRYTGIFGGLAVAGLDIVQGFQARQEQQNGLAWLYFASAGLGAGLTLTLAFPAIAFGAAIPVIGALLILVVSIAIIIEHMKDNPVQDWLERCPWGILVDKRYKDEKTEQAEFQLAIKD